MELTKVNKHVMTDGTNEYYQTEKGKWMPGSYDGKKFVWKSTAKYAARRRTFDMPDGTKKTVTLTKYTYEKFLKPAYAPIGKSGREYKRAYRECYRALYWDGEELWKAANVAVEHDADGNATRYINTIEPFYAYDQMWDRWPEVERDITTEEPKATEDEAMEEVDIIAAANKIVEAEAARLAWIESTTAEGEQISLLAYAGYAGDTAWQELAYAGGR